MDAIDIEIDKIRRNGGTQTRAELCESHIEDLVNGLGQGNEFPPVELYYDGINYWLTDGFHRTEATLQSSRNTIKAVVVPGTQQDAQWRSFSVNQHLALKRSNADKVRTIAAALKHPYSSHKTDAEIAEHCGVHRRTVSRKRAELAEADEIQVNPVRVRRNGVLQKASCDQPKKIVVENQDNPLYGEEVEVLSAKDGCFEVRTASGEIKPFFESEIMQPERQMMEEKVVEEAIDHFLERRLYLIDLIENLSENMVESVIEFIKENK